MKNLSIGILYLGLHNQLVKKFGINVIISNKEFFTKIGRHSQIPKNLRPVVLKEMEIKKLIKKVNRDKIQIMKGEFDIENNCDEFYRRVGIY